MQIPEQYNQLMPYLIIPRAGEFLPFMKQVFGAAGQMLVPRENTGLVMHGELRIGNAVIMYADATEQFTARPAGMFVYVENVDDTYVKALAAGAISTMAPAQMDYGYSCGFKDPFGNDWWPVKGK